MPRERPTGRALCSARQVDSVTSPEQRVGEFFDSRFIDDGRLEHIDGIDGHINRLGESGFDITALCTVAALVNKEAGD